MYAVLRPTTSLPRPNLRTKKYCSLINFGLHHYQPTQWLLTHSTHLSQHLYIYIYMHCAHCLFRMLFLSTYYFNCISFAIRLSGRKVAIKLIDWLFDWLIEQSNRFDSYLRRRSAVNNRRTYTVCGRYRGISSTSRRDGVREGRTSTDARSRGRRYSAWSRDRDSCSSGRSPGSGIPCTAATAQNHTAHNM